MEETCRATLSKYVRSESVIKCLELAGYTTSHVLRCLDQNQLNEVENFVRHACSRMPEEGSRAEYIGELFACEPEEFRFPGGIRCGLLLAVEEMRREAPEDTNGRTSPLVTKVTRNQVSQTDNPQPANFYWKSSPEFENRRRTPSSSGGGLLTNGSSTQIGCSLAALQKQADSIVPPTSPAESSSTGGSKTSLTPVHGPSGALSSSSGKYEAIDVEHLKHHATTSIIRLASRQFVNGSLVKDRDFDMNIELVATSDGQLRATGIFYCHLCRKKRERSSAVRFSIARNRYPVVSNVMSHLKSHFVYISPPPGTPVSSAVSPMNLTASWPPPPLASTHQQAAAQAVTQAALQHHFQQQQSGIKQEMVFPGFMSPGSQSPLDFSGLPLNMLTAASMQQHHHHHLMNSQEEDCEEDIEDQEDIEDDMTIVPGGNAGGLPQPQDVVCQRVVNSDNFMISTAGGRIAGQE